jgi:HK97 family phage prohead protease
VTEYRSAPESVKVDDAKQRQIVIDAPIYGVVDDYRTAWRPGVFDDSIERRKPSLLWGHDWRDPIGAFKDAEQKSDRLRVVYQLDDFDAVPRARQAFAQADSGTIRDASFGFNHLKTDEEPFDDDEGAVWINRARLDEHSLVLVGAVPGAGVAGVRHVAAADVLRLAHELEAGEISLDDALSMVTRIAMESETRAMHVHAKQDGSGTERHSHAEMPANHGHPGSGLMPAYALKLSRDAKAPYGNVHYADPGYQDDGVKRYPVDTEEHAKAAWSYINQAKNADKYEPGDLAKVKASIKAALSKFGVDGRAAPGTPDNLPAPGFEEVEDQEEEQIECPVCGAMNPGDALTCDKCGAELPEQSRVAISEARQLLEEIER